MGVRLAVAAATVALASPVGYVQSHQAAGGGFAEPGQRATPGLTAWAVLGLTARGEDVGAAHDYLVAHEGDLGTATDVELAALAESVSGGASPALVARLRAFVHPTGAIGPALNSTFWGVLALRQARLAAVVGHVAGPRRDAAPPLPAALIFPRRPSGLFMRLR